MAHKRLLATTFSIARISMTIFGGPSLHMRLNRLRMILLGIRYKGWVERLLNAPLATPVARLVQERPEILGILMWPYQCSGWSVEERFKRVLNHCAVIEKSAPQFLFSTKQRLLLLDLDETYPGMHIVLDQPGWFKREGQLTINIFIEEFRSYSIAFALFKEQNETLSLVIGGIQGRNNEFALKLYHDLTKAMHGMRPRDFLLEVLQLLADSIRVTRILAVNDQHRHHRHPYFGIKKFTSNYDDIWADRGGVLHDNSFYLLPLSPTRRSMDEIKPNKRSLYRHRYRFLDKVETQLYANLQAITVDQCMYLRPQSDDKE